MLGGIILLILILGGLGIMVGHTEPKRLVGFIIWLIVAPVLLAIGVNHVLWLWYGLPFWMQVLSFALLPFLALFVLQRILLKSALIRIVTDVLWAALVFAFTFPFRLAFRSTQFIVQREQKRPRLAPYQTVVGSRPPLAQPRRKLGRLDNKE